MKPQQPPRKGVKVLNPAREGKMREQSLTASPHPPLLVKKGSYMKAKHGFFTSLKCRECGRHYPKEAVHVCEFCFGPLEVDYDYELIKQHISREFPQLPSFFLSSLFLDDGRRTNLVGSEYTGRDLKCFSVELRQP